MLTTRTVMAEVARHQLQGAMRHPRPVDPDAMEITTKGMAGRRLRKLFARQNREINQALQDFWRQQVERYS